MIYTQIHIPKTAGSTIRKLTSNTNNFQLFKPNPSSSTIGHPENAESVEDQIGNKREEHCIFCSIRNPIDWYVSLYNHKMKSNVSKVKDYPIMEGNTFDDYFQDLVLMNNGIEGCRKWFKPFFKYHEEIFHFINGNAGCYTMFFAYYCFRNWRKILSSEDINLEIIHRFKDSLAVDFILPIENLQNSFEKMMESNATSCYIDFSLKVNACPHKPSLEYYSQEQLDMLSKADQSIFKLFNYK